MSSSGRLSELSLLGSADSRMARRIAMASGDMPCAAVGLRLNGCGTLGYVTRRNKIKQTQIHDITYIMKSWGMGEGEEKITLTENTFRVLLRTLSLFPLFIL